MTRRNEPRVRAQGTSSRRLGGGGRLPWPMAVAWALAVAIGCDQALMPREQEADPAVQAQSAPDSHAPAGSRAHEGTAPGRDVTHDPRGPASLQFGSKFTRAKAFPGSFAADSAAAWYRRVPDIEEVHIPSSADGSLQPALFYDSGTARAKPLMVVLHSWSVGYLQYF